MANTNKAGGAETRETFTLSTGVVIRVRAIPRDLLVDAVMRVAEPKPPTVHNESTGRYEENDNDPAYIEARKFWQFERTEAMTRACYLYGVEIVSVPDGMIMHDSQEFARKRKLLRRTEEGAEFIDWLRLEAAPTSADNALIMREVGRATGTREADVLSSMKSA